MSNTKPLHPETVSAMVQFAIALVINERAAAIHASQLLIHRLYWDHWSDVFTVTEEHEKQLADAGMRYTNGWFTRIEEKNF